MAMFRASSMFSRAMRMAPARASAPLGSTRIFIRARAKDIAAAISRSETVIMSSTCWRTRGKVHRPSEGVRAPSAMVGGLWTVWSVRVWNERVASSASSGSTPMTRVCGEWKRVAMAEPERRPPPPQQTKRASMWVSFGVSWKSSSAAVP